MKAAKLSSSKLKRKAALLQAKNVKIIRNGNKTVLLRISKSKAARLKLI